MTVPHIPILSPDQLPISLGTPLDGRSKTVVSDLINPHGFVVFRGYGVSSDQEFHDFIECFGLPNFTYAESFSNAVRRNRTPRVFTANEAPPEIEIFLHHEMAQTLVFPGQLFFFCEQAPTEGGATHWSIRSRACRTRKSATGFCGETEESGRTVSQCHARLC